MVAFLNENKRSLFREGSPLFYTLIHLRVDYAQPDWMLRDDFSRPFYVPHTNPKRGMRAG
jgi:hypothetical protein